MPTTYEEIRGYIVSYLSVLSDLWGDPDSTQALYADIRLTNLSYGFELDTDGFVVELANQQKLLIALKTSLRIASNLPQDLSYKSPVLSVSRKNMKEGLISYLNEQILIAEGNGSFFAGDVVTGIAAILHSNDNFYTEVRGAL